MFLAQIVLFLQQCPMELIVLSGKFLLGAMFENLDLPQPHYFTRALEQGGYVSIVEFYPDKLFRSASLPSLLRIVLLPFIF
jgi:hypothetical protein